MQVRCAFVIIFLFDIFLYIVNFIVSYVTPLNFYKWYNFSLFYCIDTVSDRLTLILTTLTPNDDCGDDDDDGDANDCDDDDDDDGDDIGGDGGDDDDGGGDDGDDNGGDDDDDGDEDCKH